MNARLETEPTAVVVDDVALVRLGVCAVLEPLGITVAAETAAGRDVPRLVTDHHADLVVIGSVADVVGVDLVRRIREVAPTICIVALLPRTRRDELSALLSLDVDALVVRTISTEEFAVTVDRARGGERVVSPALLSALVGAVAPTEPAEPDPEDPALTVREREVLALLAEGRSNREIAGALYVTLATVKTHLAHIYGKLGARNRNEALGRAVSLGLLS